MQRKWRRAWLRGKPHCMRHKPVRKARTGSIKAKVYDLTAKAAKKLVPMAAAAGIFFSSLTGVQANPTGGSITAGTGSITGQGTNSVAINQTSDKLAVNWNSFSIGSGEKVQFIQPGASSIALNRVLGNNASAIYGQLSANGKVFLINPNGVLFAKGAQVNVGGLVASTINLSEKDFMNGKYTFSGDSQNGVLNQGNITAANGGYVALLGANAANEGVILAKEGTVALGAGSKIALDFTGDGLLTLSVDESKVKAEVKNSGLIKADGGLVVMNAKAADALTGSVVNNIGTIEARSVTSKNGAIILTGDSLTNTGTLDASGKNDGETGGTVKVLGDTVRLATGSAITVSGDQGGGTALVGGAYQGGNSEYAATTTVVEHGASISADALTAGSGGQVVVWANDTTSFAGVIAAKGGKNSGDGGSVETSGKKTLTVADTTSVNTTAANGKTGNWLLDPADFVVDDTGAKGMTAVTLSAALQSSSVTITTTADTASSTSGATNTDTSGNGDITISSAVNWDAADNVLTLNAHRNININADVTASGKNAGLALTYATGGSHIILGPIGSYSLGRGAKITLSGESAKFSRNGNPYIVINRHSTGGALKALQNIKNTLAGKYFLGEDIDASATSTWNYGYGFYEGFSPIGNVWNRFSGCFDGGGHAISGLMINRPSSDRIGLFGYTSRADIRNVGLVGGSITGGNSVGSLVGDDSGFSVVTNSYNSGSVTGHYSVGGLVGVNVGDVTNSYSSGNVNGDGGEVGGLVGVNYGSVTNSYNSGSVTGGEDIGGLVGKNYRNITHSYNSGSVKGRYSVGGLVGINDYRENSFVGHITNSYNSGSVNGVGGYVGGLVGNNYGSVTNSYNSGSVTGGECVGGLVGRNYNIDGGSITTIDSSGSIMSSYSSGSVTGAKWVGGLFGTDVGGNVLISYWDIDTSGQASSGGDGTGLHSSTAGDSAFAKNSYKWFDFDTVWYMLDGHTRPYLRSEHSTTITNAHQLQLMALNLGASYTLANNIDMSELTNPAGMWRTSTTADSSGKYGFVPIGDNSYHFTGGFDGGGHTIGTYTITPGGLTSTNYTIAFQDGTLTVKPVPTPTPVPTPDLTPIPVPTPDLTHTPVPTPDPTPTPQIITQPEYVAAVEIARQAAATSPSAVTDTTQLAAANSASTASSPQAAGSQPSSMQLRYDSTGPARTITISGQTITIARDSLVHLQLDVVQKDIPVYQSAGGSVAPAATYRLDSSQGLLTLRQSEASFAPVSSAKPEPPAVQAETASFQLTDRRGNTANFTVAYMDGSLHVQAANALATDMLSQNRQLVAATSLVAVQDKLGLDINNLQAVYLGNR